LIKIQKATFGIKVLEGIFAKYFKDNIPEEFRKKIEN
jgi:hypothetical protein